MIELRDHPDEAMMTRRARRLATSALLLILAALGVGATGLMWQVSRLQHRQDVSFCEGSTAVVGTDAEREVAMEECVSEREGRRFGPFHVFGNGDPAGGLPQD